MIDEVHARNKDLDPELIEKEIAEAVVAVRRARRKKKAS